MTASVRRTIDFARSADSDDWDAASFSPKNKSLDPLREIAHFRFTREVMLHSIEQGDATRFLEMMQSSAFSGQFQFTEQGLGLDRLRQAALQYIGPEPIPWYLRYRVRIGIK